MSAKDTLTAPGSVLFGLKFLIVELKTEACRGVAILDKPPPENWSRGMILARSWTVVSRNHANVTGRFISEVGRQFKPAKESMDDFEANKKRNASW